jgi:aryl-alcohol dehydrogenase-like predicted oxidoreductase
MRYRPVGRSGLVVSVVGLGCNNLGKRIGVEEAAALVDAAADAGVTLLDTGDTYGGPGAKGAAETILGEVLAGRRDSFVIATKFGRDMAGEYGPDHGARGSRRYIRRAVEGSLRRLRTDYLDLYQYHQPDQITPIEETLAALHDLVTEGKVRYVGASNTPAWEVPEAAWTARVGRCTPFVSEESEYSLLRREIEADLVPALERHGLGLLPYYPLYGGILTGKVERDGEPPEGSRLRERKWVAALTGEVFTMLEALEGYAKERGVTVLDVAIGWLVAQPVVSSVIAGATKPEQVRANAAAAEWQPTPDDLAALDEIVPAHRPPPPAP